MDKPKILIITGSVGVGKSTTADAISEVLRKQEVLHAIVDMDYLGYVYPRPDSDPFHQSLSVKNLASIWKNFAELGVGRVIIPRVVESSGEITAIAKAIPGSTVTVMRLTADIDNIHARLHERHGKRDEENLNWHLDRAEVLSQQMEKSSLEDFVVDTNNKTPNEIAAEILDLWL